jgi:hypothetical protein
MIMPKGVVQYPLNSRRVLTQALPEDNNLIEFLHTAGKVDSVDNPFVAVTVNKSNGTTMNSGFVFSAIEQCILDIMELKGVWSVGSDIFGAKLSTCNFKRLSVLEFLDDTFWIKSGLRADDSGNTQAMLRHVHSGLRTNGFAQIDLVLEDEVDGVTFKTAVLSPREYDTVLQQLSSYQVEIIYHGVQRYLVVSRE